MQGPAPRRSPDGAISARFGLDKVFLIQLPATVLIDAKRTLGGAPEPGDRKQLHRKNRERKLECGEFVRLEAPRK